MSEQLPGTIIEYPTKLPPGQKIMFTDFSELAILTDLKDSPYQRNKHNRDQITRLAKIMKEDGIRHPIHISNRTNTVCFGHGRRDAALMNGWTHYPVVYQSFSSDEEEYRCVQSDNAIATWSELDLSAINQDLQSGNLGPFDVELLGIQDFFLEPAEKFINEPLPNDLDMEGPQKEFKVVVMLKVKDNITEVLKILHIDKFRKFRDGDLVSAHWPQEND